MIPEEKREKVFMDYCAGNFKRLQDLADLHDIKYPTLTRWIKDFGWKKRRKQQFDAVAKEGMRKIHETIEQVNFDHYRAWKIIAGQALVHMRPTLDEEGNPLRIDIDTVHKAAQVIRLAQQGQRLAMGADLPDANQVPEVTVTFGALTDSGDVVGGSLREVSKEIITQYEKNITPERLAEIREELGNGNGVHNDE
jgi:hypothetical protein